MRCLITQLLGGMGNQMFQYAAARRLAIEQGLRLLVDTSILEDHSPGRHEVNRHYGLDAFALRVERVSSAQRWFFNALGLPLPVKIASRLLRPFSARHIYRERTFSFDACLVKNRPPPRYIHGLWQSYKYFDTVASDIAAEFSFRKPLLDSARELRELLRRPNAVCVNVRRTDYINGSSAATMGFVGVDYYRKADRIMRKTLSEEPLYFIFSDDLEWCRRELAWLRESPVFVEYEQVGKNFSQYLQLMTQAGNFIIPNSTFGWWAAWLAKSPRKFVVAPQRWFVDESVNTNDLCPPDWMRI